MGDSGSDDTIPEYVERYGLSHQLRGRKSMGVPTESGGPGGEQSDGWEEFEYIVDQQPYKWLRLRSENPDVQPERFVPKPDLSHNPKIFLFSTAEGFAFEGPADFHRRMLDELGKLQRIFDDESHIIRGEN